MPLTLATLALLFSVLRMTFTLFLNLFVAKNCPWSFVYPVQILNQRLQTILACLTGTFTIGVVTVLQVLWSCT